MRTATITTKKKIVIDEMNGVRRTTIIKERFLNQRKFINGGESSTIISVEFLVENLLQKLQNKYSYVTHKDMRRTTLQ